VGALLLSVAGCSGLVWSGLWLGLSGLWLWFSGRWLVALVWSGQGSGWGFRGCGSGSRVGGWLLWFGLVRALAGAFGVVALVLGSVVGWFGLVWLVVGLGSILPSLKKPLREE
jgi:hypothetical protein